MTSPLILGLLAIGYLLALFAIAQLGDMRRLQGKLRTRLTIYPLALAIYCTTWTFFGSVGLATTSGLSFLAIYLGPLIIMTAGFPILKKVINLSKQQRITSVADFLGARYGKSVRVAAVATVICVIGTVPYIALQLKAISAALSQLMHESDIANASATPLSGDLSLMIVVLLSAFAILFGTRHADATEHQDGMMLSIAIESAIKLTAFLIVGSYITWWMFDGLGDIATRLAAHPMGGSVGWQGTNIPSMLVLTLLSTLAFLLLPRQFHVAVVENYSEREMLRARWMFPVYLILINLFVIPIAAAGIITFGDSVVADQFVLALPQQAGNERIAMIAFLGGLSAGTAMVIVACIALAIMISNHLVLPLYLRGDGYNIRADRTNMEKRILIIRRTAIVVILLLAYAYFKSADNTQALASIGVVSFAAAVQLAPAFFGGLFWQGGNARGAITGMTLGIAVWAWLLLLPTVMVSGTPLAGDLLPVFSVFGLSSLDSGILWSLIINTVGYILGSLSSRPSSLEDHQATVFVAYNSAQRVEASPGIGVVTVGQIHTTLARYLGRQRAKQAFDAYWLEAGYRAQPREPASPSFIRFSEETLGSAIGASSSRLVHSLLLQRFEETSTTNLKLLKEATVAIEYNQSILRTALDQLDQGITVFDADLQLTFRNQQFRKLLDLADGLSQVGTPLSAIAYSIAQKHRADADDHNFDDLEERLRTPRRGWGLALPRNERILEIRSSPMPDGGLVITWNDVTERMMFAEALKEANESLEKRVEERTRDLVHANTRLERATKEADLANQSKTRFLSAAGHDLMQPLNAARLYTSTLLEKAKTGDLVKLGSNISRSLESVEEILGSVLAISKLDTTEPKLSVSAFPMQRLFDQLEIEFQPSAEEKDIELRMVPSTLWVKSDPALLRRLLQNLVSNAIKYTNAGKVLVGCRRKGNDVLIEVMDTGVGIDQSELGNIFKEFERLDAGMRLAPGLGLGLSIVERISKVLEHPVTIRSNPGRGTRFTVQAPRTISEYKRIRPDKRKTTSAALSGIRVLCVDNDETILDSMRGLLEQWGCAVTTASNGEAAETLVGAGERPNIALIDYHLDDETGLEVANRLRVRIGEDFAISLVTADRSSEIKREADKQNISILNKPVRPAALRALISQLVRPAIAAE